MPSVAQQVRDAITTEIAKVSGIGETGSNWRTWLQNTRLPAAYTILDTNDQELDTRDKRVRGHFRIPCVLKSATPEDAFDDLAKAIEDQLEDDPSLGNLVELCYVSGIGPFATAKAVSGEYYTRDVFVEVVYKHTRGTA